MNEVHALHASFQRRRDLLFLGALFFLPSALPDIRVTASIDELQALVDAEKITEDDKARTEVIDGWIAAQAAPSDLVARGNLLLQKDAFEEDADTSVIDEQLEAGCRPLQAMAPDGNTQRYHGARCWQHDLRLQFDNGSVRVGCFTDVANRETGEFGQIGQRAELVVTVLQRDGAYVLAECVEQPLGLDVAVA